MRAFPTTLTKKQRRFLRRLFPGRDCLTAPEETGIFGTDAGRLFSRPLAVVRPAETAQVAELLAWAQAEHVPVYPRLRATNRVGGCVPVHGGVVVSMLGMDRILEVDPDDAVAVCQPGVITADLARAAEAEGLFYPPDPASVRIATIGGNAATCAGGMRALKYGVTREYVLGLTAVLPGGRVITPGGRCHKDVVGLDLVRLLVGSAGTLGIFTELTLKLLPGPTASASVLAGFACLADAIAAAGAVFRAGLLPAAMECMDRMALTAAAAIGESFWDEGAGVRAALLLRLDGGEACVDADLDALVAVLRGSGAVDMRTGRGEDEEPLWAVRRVMSQAAYHLRPGKSAEDVAVPRGAVGRAVEGFHAIGEELGLPVLCFGHLGDGNIHVNLLYDPDDEAECRALKKARDKVFRLALALGGTVSGEHGTGLTKGGLLARQLGEDQLDIIRGIKRVFDPGGILNPGKGW